MDLSISAPQIDDEEDKQALDTLIYTRNEKENLQIDPTTTDY